MTLSIKDLLDEDQFLPEEKVAKLTGYSPITLKLNRYRNSENFNVPFVKIGKKIYYPTYFVEKWMQERFTSSCDFSKLKEILSNEKQI